MRKLMFLLPFLLAQLSVPALAANSVTVAQLDRLLAAAHDQPDAKVAQDLSTLELSERVSAERLSRWQAGLPGQKSLQALVALADASAFFDLPAEDMPAAAAPRHDQMCQMLFAAYEYVINQIPQLPNFFATRETAHFEDTPSELRSQVASAESARPSMASPSMQVFPYRPLHIVDKESVRVFFHGGHELVDAGLTGARKLEAAAQELVTPGLFGPILGVVLGDAKKGTLAWSHWEQGADGPEAVFRYSVPAQVSHYAVAFPHREMNVQNAAPYHGEIAVNPATGAIMRLTEVADLKSRYPITKADILVEYGPVEIGGKTYICPVKSVALFSWKAPDSDGTISAGPDETKLNDIQFTQYHVFRSEARILTADAQPAQSSAPVAASSETIPAQTPQSTPAQPASAQAGQSFVPTATSTEQAAAPAPISPPSLTTASSDSTSVADGAVLHLNSNLVLVDVVVTDHGNAVHSLDRSHFHVYEDGREQTVSVFDEHRPAPVAPVTSSVALPPGTYSNLPIYPPSTAVDVLLLDGMNTPVVNQADVRQQMLDYIAKMQPGTPLAIFTLGTRLRLIQGFTTDTLQLAAVLRSPKAAPQASVAMDQGVADALRDDANRVEENAPALVASTGGNTISPAMTALIEDTAAHLRQSAADVTSQLADQQVLTTLRALQQLARYLSAIPGRKNLVWFSGSFPIEIPPEFTTTYPAVDLRLYSDELRETTQLLARARVAVYPVYAVGPLSNPSLQESYTFPDKPSFGAPGFADTDARSLQLLQSDLSSMVKIAEQTGGEYFNTNAIKDALATAVENGASYYTIGYVPDAKKVDGHFRNIKLRVEEDKYNVSYRRGYYADRPGKSPVHNPGEANLVSAAIQLGAPPSTQILFQAHVLSANDPQLGDVKLPQGPAGDGAATLKGLLRRTVVDLSLDPHSLAFEEMPEGVFRTEVEYALVAYDATGKRVNSIDQGVRLNLKPDQYARIMTGETHLAPHRMVIDLPSGDVALRIAIYDPSTARAGSLEVPLERPTEIARK
jgi:VWFA-related protein